MTKDNKTTTPPPKKPATGAVGGAAPRKKLTLNTTAFQKGKSHIKHQKPHKKHKCTKSMWFVSSGACV